MTADAQHRSSDVPPSSSFPAWSTPPASGEPPWAAPATTPTAHDGTVPPRSGPPRLSRRITALVASGALAVGLIGGVGIGRVTAPAAQGTGTSAGGFPQGGPGGMGFPGGAQGQGGMSGGVQGGVQGGAGAQGGTGLQGGTSTQGLPSDPGAAGAPDQSSQSGQLGAAPDSSTTSSQDDTTTT